MCEFVCVCMCMRVHMCVFVCTHIYVCMRLFEGMCMGVYIS